MRVNRFEIREMIYFETIYFSVNSFKIWLVIYPQVPALVQLDTFDSLHVVLLVQYAFASSGAFPPLTLLIWEELNEAKPPESLPFKFRLNDVNFFKFLFNFIILNIF